MSDCVIEAVVQVGSEETRYLRRGRGAGVIVVLAEDERERARLLERLGSAACVIAPVLVPPGRFDPVPDTGAADGEDGAGGGELESWLLGVIDGLGLVRPGVVLSPALAHLAPRLSRNCADALILLEPVDAGGG